MPTPFTLTRGQARKLGLPTEAKRTNKPRTQATPAEKHVQRLIKQAEMLVEQVRPLCLAYGWRIGLCRLPSDDPHVVEYPSIRDDEATPNCVVAWRDSVDYAMPRVVHVVWLWELQSQDEPVARKVA